MARFGFVLIFMVLVACGGSQRPGNNESSTLPVEETKGLETWPRQEYGRGAQGRAFVPNETCQPCHEQPFADWTGSHHDLAMSHANENTVRGDFKDVTFTASGTDYRFYRRDGRFLVWTEGPDGKPGEFEVKFTFGIQPLQQYLVELPGGRLQSLTIAWDTEKGRWFDLHPDENIGPEDPRHWSNRLYRWNDRCADCHSTNLKMGYRSSSDTFETTWATIDVSCQACHGPGEAHLAWASLGEEAREADPTQGLTVLTREMSASDQVDTCAPCHARRHAVSVDPTHGQPLLDHYMPALLREGLYFPDGQIDEEVYVYGSYLQSKMYQRGVRCTDCHNPHTLQIKVAGNGLCLPCHNPGGNPRFPTLVRKNYDSPEHHFHRMGTEAAQCVNCHMPARTYMIVDPRRDHSFRVPRPDLSMKLGSPNACNDCHEDQSPDWAQQAVVKWYGNKPPPSPHYGEVFAKARQGAPEAIQGLKALATDREQAAIVRATAVEHLAAYGSQGRASVAVALTDENPLVRATAVDTAGFWEPPSRVPALWPLLSDSVRAVRIEAALALAGIPPGDLEPEKQQVLQAAVEEYEQAQKAAGEQPEPFLNLGILYTRLGKLEKAEYAYRKALRIDPGFIPGRVNLGNLYNRMGRNAEAETQFRQALDLSPEEGELHYSLGLLLAEMGDYPNAALHLERAAARIPYRSRVHFNLGKMLNFLGRNADGERALLYAQELEPDNPAYIQELAMVYIQSGRWAKALPFAEQLVALFPENPSVVQMLQQIRARLKRER